IAGFVLAAMIRSTQDEVTGQILGMRLLVGISLALSIVTVAIQFRWMPHREITLSPSPDREVLRRFPIPLRRLLLAEVFTRWCDWLVREFVVLYLLLVLGVPVGWVGVLFGVQHLTALLTYLPIGQLTGKVGLEPFIGVTFIFFALF